MEIPLLPWHGNHLATEQLLGILFPFCSLHRHRTVTGLEILTVFQEPTEGSSVAAPAHTELMDCSCRREGFLLEALGPHT